MRSFSLLPRPFFYVPISEGLMANRAFEGPLARVQAQMALQHPRSIKAFSTIRTIMHGFVSLPGLRVLPRGCLALGHAARHRHLVLLLLRHQVKRLGERLSLAAVDQDLLIPVDVRELLRINRFRRFRAGRRGCPRRDDIVEQYRGCCSRIDSWVPINGRRCELLRTGVRRSPT